MQRTLALFSPVATDRLTPDHFACKLPSSDACASVSSKAIGNYAPGMVPAAGAKAEGFPLCTLEEYSEGFEHQSLSLAGMP